MDALSSGITEIIWEHVLIQISESDVAKADEYQQQYLLLTESLQKQIDDLSKKKTRISIQANIVDNTEMTTEELLEKLQGMNDEELASLTNNLGISADQLKEYIENNIANSENNLSDDLNKQMNDLKKELQKEIKTETSNATGKAGVAGKNGSDGKDGQDGKSIFYRYAEDASGRNWSSAPNDKTKYIGIYTGTRASTNPADYSWSKYSGNDGADGQSVFTVFSEDGVQWYHADEMPQGLEIKWMATAKDMEMSLNEQLNSNKSTLENEISETKSELQKEIKDQISQIPASQADNWAASWDDEHTLTFIIPRE